MLFSVRRKNIWDCWLALKRFWKDVYIASTMLFSIQRKLSGTIGSSFGTHVKFLGLLVGCQLIRKDAYTVFVCCFLFEGSFFGTARSSFGTL